MEAVVPGPGGWFDNTHYADKGHVVHQRNPHQHFSAHELTVLLQGVKDKVWPLWLAENGNDPAKLLGLRYAFSEIGCEFDDQGRWYRRLSDGYVQRLNFLDYAFWHTREEICRGLLAINHLRNHAIQSSGIPFISAEAELRTHLYQVSITEPETNSDLALAATGD